MSMLLSALVRSTDRRCPALLQRLGVHGRKRFGIQVSDAPLAFVLEPGPRRCTALRRLPRTVDVRIDGTLADLLELVDGELDADALFFSRRLAVVGDLEAGMALRNAIDDARLDMAAEAAALAPLFRPVVEQALRAGLALVRGAGRPQWS